VGGLDSFLPSAGTRNAPILRDEAAKAGPPADKLTLRELTPQRQVRSIVRTFSSGREAKEYLIAQIVLEAEREGMPLSETERKMMHFTETAWTLPDIWEVNEVFERDYDQQTYEGKIGKLARKARARGAAANELETWKEAVRALKREDHYLLVLLAAPTGSSDSLLVDRLKLVGTALLVCLLLIAGVFLFSSKK
jgi:hypothetical protein